MTHAAGGTFVVADGGARWRFDGTLTMDTAAAALASSRAIALPASGIVDFAGLAQADSAALAVMIALKRRAAGENRRLALAGVPSSLASLAVVYGVDSLLQDK